MSASGLRTLPKIPARARLVFVETAAEAREALEGWRPQAVDAAVALAPESAAVLRAAGRPYLALEDAYDPRRIVNLAEEVLQAQQAWARRVDTWLQERFAPFAEQNFRPARLYLYWLKVAFDSLAIRAYPLTWALEQWHPSWIWHPSSAPSHAEFGWDLTFRESLYPAVLQAVTNKLGIEAQVTVGVESFRTNDPMSPPHWSKRPPAIAWARAARAAIGGAWQTAQMLRATGDDILILGDSYDLRPVLRAAVRRRIRVEQWRTIVDYAREASTRNCDMLRAMSDAWTAALSEIQLLAPVVVDGCDLRQIAEARVRFWWEVLIPQQWSAFVVVRERWRARSVRAVAVSGVADHIERGVFAAMRSLGVRTYMYQHGGFVGACECPPWDCNDLALAEYELTYGRGTAQYFSSRPTYADGGRATPIAVGSSRLDSLRKTIHRGRHAPRRKRVLLVPNLIPRNNRYFDAGTTPDVLESELQEAMVACAREFAAHEFIFKAFPYHDQRDTPAVALARTPGSNCRVEFDTPLPSLIAEADLIALLFPSTALLEALLSDRAVIVLVDPRFVEMRAAARAALERRATVADAPAQFLDQLRGLLQDGRFQVSTPVDDQFLREFGTHLDDGKSADRAVAALASTPAAAWDPIVISPPTAS